LKTAIFGGTFNPVHKGHLAIAQAALEQTECGVVLFVPAFLPPHKSIDDPGPELRLAMLEESVKANPAFKVSDCEIRRAGISYSIDTIRFLVETGVVEKNPFLIIGDDLAEGFLSWKSPELIEKECTILIAHRQFAEKIELPFAHIYLENSIIPLASSGIRAAIEAGEQWRDLVPEAARQLIEKHGLYGLK
jgi:nicotinate-nucleotide adenylyltransferase